MGFEKSELACVSESIHYTLQELKLGGGGCVPFWLQAHPPPLTFPTHPTLKELKWCKLWTLIKKVYGDERSRATVLHGKEVNLSLRVEGWDL